MAFRPSRGMRGVLTIWATGIALGLAAGAIAASMLRHTAPEVPAAGSLAAHLR